MRYSKLCYFGLPAAGAGLFTLGFASLSLFLPVGPSWTKAVLLCGLTISAAILSLLSYRHADEIILGRHKTAWFWGSMAGALISLPIVIGYGWNLIPLPSALALPASSPQSAFALGFGLLWIMQGLGFAIMRTIRHSQDRGE